MRAMLMCLALMGCATEPSPAPPISQPNTIDLFCQTRRACAGSPEENNIVMMSAVDAKTGERNLVNECESEACEGALACEAVCCPVGMKCN